MNKLLKAALYRLKLQKLFWIMLSASLIYGIAFGMISIFENDLDGLFMMPLFLIMGIYVSLSIGQEYEESIIRNKVIVGHTKGTIFLSELIINGFICLLMMLAFLIPVIVCCYVPLLSTIPLERMLVMLIDLFLVSILYSAIYTLISCLIPKKALGAVLCVLIAFALAFASYKLEYYIFQVERMTSTELNEFGQIISEEVIPNPNYIDGTLREIFVAADSFIPNGQTNNLMVYLLADNTESDSIPVFCEDMLSFYPVYSIGLAVVLSFVGWLAFRKKELK